MTRALRRNKLQSIAEGAYNTSETQAIGLTAGENALDSKIEI